MKIGKRCYRVVKCPVRKKKKRVSKKAARARARAAIMGEGIPPVKLTIKPWTGRSDKAYIIDLYEKTRDAFNSRARFNEALLGAHRNTPGGILSRLDLVSAANPTKTAASRIHTGNAEYHLVNLTAAKHLAKEWG